MRIDAALSSEIDEFARITDTGINPTPVTRTTRSTRSSAR